MFRAVPLPDGSYSDLSRPWSQQDVCNYLPDVAEGPGTRSPARLLSPPGLQECLVFGEGPHRGARNVEGRLFVASDRYAWTGNPDTGEVTQLGVLPGHGRVSITHNQVAGGNQVVFAVGSSAYVYNTATGAYGPITDNGFPGMIQCDFIAQLIVGLEPQRRYFFNSDLVDATSYNALEQQEAESSPDRLRAIIVANNQLIALGERTTEFYAYTGVTNALFERVTVIDVGCAGTHTVCKLDNRIFWVSHNGGVYTTNGYQPVRISTVPMERALALCDLSKAFAFTWEDQGRCVYYLTCPDGLTWGYDCSTRKWHRRESFGMDRWRLNSLVKWKDDWYGGSCLDGMFYRLDWNYWREGSQDMVSSIGTAIAHDSQNRLTLHAVEPIFDTGGPEGVSASLGLVGNLLSGAVGDDAETTYQAFGERTLPLTFSIIAGSLPPGTDMDENGLVSGTFTLAGFYEWTVQVEDADGNTATLDDTAGVISLTGDPPPGAVGEAYSYALIPAGGVEPYVITLESGALPDGLDMDTDGLITGTPDSEDTFAFVARLTDAEGNTTTESFEIVIGSFVVISDLPDGVVGDIVSYQVTQVGGAEPVVYSIDTGSLPAGLSMDAAGLITGTRSASGTATFTVKGVDDDAIEATCDDTSITMGLLLLAVGDNGAIASSEDPAAVTWADEVSGTGEDLNAVCIGSAAHIVVGSKTGSGIILRSTDNGDTWSSITTNVTCNHLQGVATNSVGIVVAVGNSGGSSDGKIARSTDDGATFANVTAPTGCGPLSCICYSADLDLWVALSTTGKAIVSADDGATWVKYTATGTSIAAVCYSEDLGLFMAVGNQGRTITSTLGASWTVQSTQFGVSASFNGVTAVGSRFIGAAAGNPGYPGMYVSEDNGATWTKAEDTANTTSACQANGNVYVGETTADIWASDDDGDTWTENASGLGQACNGIAGGLVP